MAPASSCPSSDRLRGLLDPATPVAEQTELVDHVGHCAVCQRALEELTGANAGLLTAANALKDKVHEEAPLRRVLSDLEDTATRTAVSNFQDRTTWVQSLLKPGASADALGLLDAFEVMELIGQGGMGLVFKALDPSLNRTVAIKVLAPDLASDTVARQRFAREAKAAAAVHHENVVTIHSVNEGNGLPYIVMEYVGGGSVQEYLDSQGAADWHAVARLGAEVASGLAAAHERGLIHRDIKPSNILLEAEPRGSDLARSKITDFGVAQVADEARLTVSGIVPGTPMYMAPEQALCEPLDARADLFSLGSVLYALCTGLEPFSGGSPIAVLRQVCEVKPRPIRTLNPAIPSWLASIVERLHAKRPADRFASAAEVAELLSYNLGHPDQPRLAPPPQREMRSRSMRRLLVGSILAGVLLIGGLALSEVLHWTHLFGWGTTVEDQANGVKLRATLGGHTGPVWSIAFAPDGATVATGSDDTTVRFWDPAAGEEKAQLPKHSSAVFAVAFGHSGTFLITGDSDGRLRLWDFPSLKEQPPLPHGIGNVRRLAISPDDKTVAVGSSAQGVELVDIDRRTIRQKLSGHNGTIQSIAFAPNGKILAAGDTSGQIRFFDPATGAEQAQFSGDTLGLRALAFSPDSEALGSAGPGDKDVKLWEVAMRKKIATFSGYENEVLNLAFSPDGRFLASGSRDGTVKIWDVFSLQLLSTLHAHQGSVLALAFSPDSHTLATAGEDRLGKLWDLSTL